MGTPWRAPPVGAAPTPPSEPPNGGRREENAGEEASVCMARGVPGAASASAARAPAVGGTGSGSFSIERQRDIETATDAEGRHSYEREFRVAEAKVAWQQQEA